MSRRDAGTPAPVVRREAAEPPAAAGARPRYDRRRAALVAVLGALLAGGCAAGGDDRVQFTATDGAQLVGHLDGARGPGIVFAHSRRTDQRGWRGFARETAAAGFRTLTFDFRGYGESGGEQDLGTVDRDLEGAYRYLVGRKIRPIFLVGASMGGTAVLLVAGRVPVAGIATLSAPLTLGDRDAAPVLPSLRGAKLFVAAEGDASAVATLQVLRERVPDPKITRVLPGAAHGMELMVAEPTRTAVASALRDLFFSNDAPQAPRTTEAER
jgi:pimeloyl-ACP methyl ester carboxylesterase